MYLAIVRHIRARSSSFNRPNPFPLAAGVPQGSLLSATLYTIFIDELLEELEKYQRDGWNVKQNDEIVFAICCLAFADDLAVCSRSASGLQNLLDVCSEMSDRLAFSWNADKSFVMVSGRRNPNEVFSLDGKIVQVVEVFRYLGALLSHDADWGAHVESRIALCRSRSNFTAEQIKQLAYVSPVTAVTFWKAVCRPVLEYGFESAVLSQEHIAEMDKVQFQFFQRALLLPLQTPQAAVFAELGISGWID